MAVAPQRTVESRTHPTKDQVWNAALVKREWQGMASGHKWQVSSQLASYSFDS